MTIWQYDSSTSDKGYVRSTIDRRVCKFCSATMTELHSTRSGDRVVGGYEQAQFIVMACSICGWWTKKLHESSRFGKSFTDRIYGAVSVLREFDVSGLKEPLSEVRRYLLAKYESRFELDPRIFEETVAAVFADSGYVSRVTAYSSDGGVDVVLDGPNDTTVAVQVKRYQDKVGVDAIRSFMGVLVADGYTKGIFVTTSGYTRGAKLWSKKSDDAGYPIELVDAEKFYEALKITKRPMYAAADQSDAPFSMVNLIQLHAETRTIHGVAG